MDRKTKALIKAQEAEKNKKKEDLMKQVEATKAQEWLDAEIVKCKSSPKVADDIRGCKRQPPESTFKEKCWL